MRRLLLRLDEVQRDKRWIGFPVAVITKFGEDRGGRQAALIAFYGFFSLFPLLLVAVTVLGFFLDDPGVRDAIVGSALSGFPIIGDQISANVSSIKGSAPALTFGILAATWAGLGAVSAIQDAMNVLWGVRSHERLGRIRRTLRALLMLAALALAVVSAAAASALTGPGASMGQRLISTLVAGVINTALFWAGFRILTSRVLSWRDVFPGAMLAGVGWMLLQAVGGWLVQTRIDGASATYGFFAIVIGLLSWMLVSAQVILIAAEVNVVHKEALWPRAIFGGVSTEADVRAGGESR